MKQVIGSLKKDTYYHQVEYYREQIQRVVKYNYNHLNNIMEYGSTFY